MYTMYLRQNTGGGGGGGPSRFGHARTRTLADQGKKVTCNDVAGADEEKMGIRDRQKPPPALGQAGTAGFSGIRPVLQNTRSLPEVSAF